MPFDPISFILARKGVKLPTLKDLIIDTDKDWRGHRIKNLGEPVDPGDATSRIYVDVATTGLGINFYLLDEADPEVTAYKRLSLTLPELPEAYVEVTSSAAGDVEVGSWIAPAEIPVLKLGVYTLHLQAERVSGNIDVRLFFRLYERDAQGNETLIAESSVSDLVSDRKNLIVSMVLANDYTMQEGSRLVLKIYARFLASGSTTTVRLYYQGNVRSRLATPTGKEILDKIYASLTHAAQHALGGFDPISIDASQITSGTFSVDRIPNLPRSKITDLFSSPFWDNIPDKPSTYPPDLHAASHALGGPDQLSLDASQVTSGTFSLDRIPDLPRSKITDLFTSPFWDNIPDKPSTYPPEPHTHGISDLTDFVNVTKIIVDTSANRPAAGQAGRLFFETDTHIIYYDNGTEWVKLGVADWEDIVGKPSKFPPELHASAHGKNGSDPISIDASQVTSGTLSVDRIPNLPRSKISDFFASPFWNNIPDKPSTFPPSSHASSHAKGGSDELSLDASQITSGTLSLARIPQGDGSGLDADMVDGKHYSDLKATTPQDVTASRALSTPYQNTTGKTKIVIVSLYFSGYPVTADAEFRISPDNWTTIIPISRTGVASQGIDQYLVLYGVVPNGYYYDVYATVTDGTVSIDRWIEYEIP